MTVYKCSSEFGNINDFAGIIFDCDGVLIDSSRSYDQALVVCSRAFANILGLDFDDQELMKAIGEIRKLGTFNNDWDSQAIIVDYLFSRSSDRIDFDTLSKISPLSRRLASFESMVFGREHSTSRIGFNDLIAIVSPNPEGTSRDELSKEVLRDDSLAKTVGEMISYPMPVGEGMLSTLFDEVVYGKKVFREMYGFDCYTQKLSDPGLITNERKLVANDALVSFSSASDGNLGIITGRPRVPTMFTMGESFREWFRRPEICLFTGDYILESEEVKPSPKPMLKVAENLPRKGPILYVGDSGEDLLMAKNANKTGELDDKVYFAGVATNQEKARYFESEDGYVDCIVSDVNELGSLIKRITSKN